MSAVEWIRWTLTAITVACAIGCVWAAVETRRYRRIAEAAAEDARKSAERSRVARMRIDHVRGGA